MIRKLAALLAGAALLLGAGAVRAQTVDDIIKKGTLTVAIDTTTPPYAMLGTEMQPQGFDIDLANLIAKTLGVKIEFVTVNSPGRIPALLTNRVDIVVSIFSITAERAEQVWFSIPYAGQCSALLGPKDHVAHSLKDLEGKKVAVTRGAAEDTIISAYSKEHGDSIQILRFDDYPSTTSAMLSGQVDFVGGGDYGDIYFRKTGAGQEMEMKFTLKCFHFGIGMRRGQVDLKQWLNTFIYTVKNDGTLDALSQKWRKAPLPSLPVF
ncbi:MAG TPA: transporter substrate-binding domain-containing protein [Acetobacteraceae bacterium]|jgi:polar amino acid transport system substrate-binding protein|nr:transporter substrate-binding domain-containing protein [Acetobacteraceae bacterium]